MGYFSLKFAAIALLLAAAAFAFPAGALHAARRARRKHARTPLRRGLTGAQVAGLILHHERLDHVAVESGAEPLRERYDPASERLLLSHETARGRSVHAAATAAFLAAQVTLHADRDADFERAHRRDRPLLLAANLLPPVTVLGLILPGAGRSLLLLGTPFLLARLVALTCLSLPSSRNCAGQALRLIERHGISSEKTEREALRGALAARASLALAAPLTRCLWIRWAL